MNFPILSLMTFTPFLGMVLILLLRKEQANAARFLAGVFSFIPLVLSFILLSKYDGSTSQLQFVEKFDWIPSLGVTYFMGADGLSVPMYFLIGIWGHGRKEYSAIKFFLYTLFGSLFMLVGILALYFTVEPHTLNMMTLIGQTSQLTRGFQLIVFLAFYIAFAIKVPVFPFHTWLPALCSFW
jgi:NADH:ubiquinone oxidoreductase subunit 4 (subunit M)